MIIKYEDKIYNQSSDPDIMKNMEIIEQSLFESGIWSENDTIVVNKVFKARERGCVLVINDWKHVYKSNNNDFEFRMLKHIKQIRRPHRNIIVPEVISYHEHNNYYHYILPYGGEDVSSRKEDDLLDFLPQIVSAVDYMHKSLKILHCDLTPYNIVYDGQTVKIIDFDHAKSLKNVNNAMTLVINADFRQNIHPYFNGHKMDLKLFRRYFKNKFPMNWQKAVDYYNVLATVLRWCGIKLSHKASYNVLLNNDDLLLDVIPNHNKKRFKIIRLIIIALASFEPMYDNKPNIMDVWRSLRSIYK